MFFPEDEKLGVDRITKYMERMKEENVDKAIIVLQKPLSAKGKSQLSLSAHKFHIQDVRSPHPVKITIVIKSNMGYFFPINICCTAEMCNLWGDVTSDFVPADLMVRTSRILFILINPKNSSTECPISI